MVRKECLECGTPFDSYPSLNRKYCSKECGRLGRISKVDPDKIRKLYSKGMSQDQIAQQLGVTQKIIFSAMKRNNIQARRKEK